MNSFIKLMCYAVLVMLILGFCLLAAGKTCAAEPVPYDAPTESTTPERVRLFTIHGKELRLYGEEAEMIVQAVSCAAGGSMRLPRNEPSGEAAPYAARVGIIATIFNRMADDRFPSRASRVMAADPTLRAQPMERLRRNRGTGYGQTVHGGPFSDAPGKEGGSAALRFVKKWNYFDIKEYSSTKKERNAAAEEEENFNLQLSWSALEAALSGFDPTCGALYFRLPGDEEVPFTVTCEIGGIRFGTA